MENRVNANTVGEKTTYPVKSMTISGNSVSEYVILCDTSVEFLKNNANNLQKAIFDFTGIQLEIKDTAYAADKKIIIELVSPDSKFNYSVKTDGDSLILSGTDQNRVSNAVNYILREYFGKRNYYAGFYYQSVSENIKIENLNVSVDYMKINSFTVGGKDISKYTIVYSSSSTLSTKFAAEQLQEYILRSTAIKLAVQDDTVAAENPTIRIVYLEEMDENYSIKTDDSGLVISGGKRGVLYGVYNFLEKFVGWAFLPYGTDVLMSETDTIVLDSIDYEYKQYFYFRSPFFYSFVQNSFAAKNMINSNIGKRKEGSDFFGGFYGFTGSHCHTYAALLGDSSHEASIGPNPCFYDEDNYNKVLSSLRKILSENPDADIISVSPNDSAKYCTCDKCQGRDIGGNLTDGHLRFVNRLADEIGKDYPKVKLHTLAYGPMQSLPKVIVPRDNVIIQLCSIKCCYKHPHEQECCEANKKFMADLKGWAKLTENIIVWDYATNFVYFLSTYPNFNVIRENMQTFHKYNVKGVFEQGDLNNYFGKFEDLTCYLLAKLMENPYMSEEEFEAITDRFMKGYYGEGWKYIRKYYDFLRESNSKCSHFGIYATPNRMYDENDFIQNYREIDSWFDAAQAQVTDDSQLQHIRCLRITYRYMRQFFIYNAIMENGTEAEKAELLAENEKVFDDICRESWRLLDVHMALGNYIGQVDKTAHPKKWALGEHSMGSMPDHGMPGSGDLGDAIYGGK